MLYDAHKSLNKSARVSVLELRKVRFRQGKKRRIQGRVSANNNRERVKKLFIEL